MLPNVIDTKMNPKRCRHMFSKLISESFLLVFGCSEASSNCDFWARLGKHFNCLVK